jgi:hypothetical protein
MIRPWFIKVAVSAKRLYIVWRGMMGHGKEMERRIKFE